MITESSDMEEIVLIKVTKLTRIRKKYDELHRIRTLYT